MTAGRVLSGCDRHVTRGLRGGAFSGNQTCTCAPRIRDYNVPSFRLYEFGFRVVEHLS